jgi:hypothetical protein
MTDQKLTDILANLVRANAARGPLPNMQQVTGLSQAILSRQPVQNPYNAAAQNNQPDPRGPSFVNRVLDVLSRPLYGVLNPVKHELEEHRAEAERGDLSGLAKGALSLLSPITNLPEIAAGVSGKEKTTGRDLFKAAGLEDEIPKPVQAGVGFGIDVLADPLNAIGAGFLPKIGKGAKASTEALRAVEEGTERASQDIADVISRKAAQQADENRIVVPKPGEPAPKLTDPPRLFQAGPGPIGLAEQKAAQAPTEVLREVITKPRKPVAALPAAPIKEDLIGQLRSLNEQIATAKSPVAKNLLRKEAEKLRAGVKPADVLSEVRTAPPAFPDISINPRWVETARETAQKFLGRNRLKNINHVGQSNLYNSILNAASKVRKDRRAFHVFQMLRVAEDEILNAGRHLTDAEGISVRLSDVANMVGGPRALNSRLVDDFRKARPSQQIEDLKAFTTPQVASEILDPVVKTGADLAKATEELPPSQTVMIGSEISKELSKIAEAAGASSREAKTAKQFVTELFNPERDKLYSTVQQQARHLVRQSADGVINPEALHKISEETYKALGANPKVLGRQVEQTRVVEGIMTKFATWWGAKDLKPFSREYIDTARNVAAAFAETIKPLVAKTTQTQRKVAWSVARGKISAGTPQEQALADQFRYIVERLMGTHGITDNAEAVVLRSGTLMKELNDELPKTLQFIGNKGRDTLGNAFDYSNGQWMHSWKEWDVKEPAEALYQLTRSLQLVTRKNAMWDDAAIRWGMPVRGSEFQHTVKGIPRLQGTYFPKQIADQLNNLNKQMARDVFRTPHKSIELFDKVQRMWKTGVTIYSPSHHIRNLNGDIYLAALDGVVSPKPYAIATKVLHAFPTRYKSLESVFNIMDPQLRERALHSRPGNIVVTTRRGDKLTAEQIYQAAESQGLFVRAGNLEDLVGEGSSTFGPGFKPLGGKLNDLATRTSELRDHWVRLAHFVDVLGKSNQPLRVAIEQAGRRVRKFHPDGMDLTGFEQNILRRIIPFYSWMRKATPLVIEGALMRPHITLAFPKAMTNIQVLTGVESEGPGDPFPMDQMFPDWLKEKGIGPILQPGSGLGRDENWRGEAPGYTIINPTNPFTDQLAEIGNPGKTVLSSLTPGLRIPVELLTGRTTLGIPLEASEGGTPGYLAQQIPAVGLGARLTGATRDNEPYNPEQLINYLTGLGVTGTGPYKQQSRTEIQNLMTELAKKNRGDYR